MPGRRRITAGYHFSLVQTGAGIEAKITDIFLISLSGNYYKGLHKTTQMDITYEVNNSVPLTGTAISNGDFWCASIGLKYAVSNLWKKI